MLESTIRQKHVAINQYENHIASEKTPTSMKDSFLKAIDSFKGVIEKSSTRIIDHKNEIRRNEEILIKLQNDLNKVEEMELSKSIQRGKIIGIATISAAIIGGSYLLYKRYFTEQGKKCGPIKDPSRRKKCIEDVKYGAIRMRISVMRSKISKCSDSRDVNGCKNKVNEKIRSLQAKLTR